MPITPKRGSLFHAETHLKLAELRDYFQAEQDRSGDKVELPLVKLPAESVAYWGTATILLLTMYWFAVFRDFGLRAKPDDKAWDTPLRAFG
jgi:hypothetical protein